MEKLSEEVIAMYEKLLSQRKSQEECITPPKSSHQLLLAMSEDSYRNFMRQKQCFNSAYSPADKASPSSRADLFLEITQIISSVAGDVSVSDALEIATTLLDAGFKKD